MSDEEEVMSGEEESEEEESREPTPEPEEREEAPVDSGPSEAERAMQRRRAQKQIDTSALDEEGQALLESNQIEREAMENEIEELRQRRERRKKEREQEDREMAKRRGEEEIRRKKEEEERQSKKIAEEGEKRDARAAKMAEFEKYKSDSAPNFVITKKTATPGAPDEEDEEGGEKKSKEQLEAEKRAILEQRIPKLEIDGADTGKLTDKAKELHALIMRLESEKYDLEKRFKTQQYDMMELAERARQMNKVGRGGLKRVTLGQEESDVMQEKFAGCPSKVLMFSPFERQKDNRNWGDRAKVFKGAHFIGAVDRINPTRILAFNEKTHQPQYKGYLPGCEPGPEEEEEE